MNRTTFSTLRALGAVAALFIATAGVARAQRAVIHGTVLSEGQQPIEGASIVVPELTLQTATDAAGKYTLTIPALRVHGQVVTVRVRMIGFRPGTKSVTLAAGGDFVADFTLMNDVNRLEEIVVTGVMQGVAKTQATIDVARVDATDLPVLPSVDPLTMLEGRVAGANIVTGSGRPGDQASVLLRGPTSINSQDRTQGPLYIVDGTIINGNLPSLNPADIENVEVVKGAAASSLYGARAGGGVISITTKSGRLGREGLTWNFRTEVGRSDIERTFRLARNTDLLMNAQGTRLCVAVAGQPLCAQSIDWATEAARINNAPGDYALSPVAFPLDPGSGAAGAILRNNFMAQQWPGRTFNAVNQVIDPQLSTNNNLDVTGRFGQTQFYASGSWTGQGGAIRYLRGYNRWTTRVNVDQQLATNWSIGLRTFYAHSWEDGLNVDGASQQSQNSATFFPLTRVPALANILATDTLGRLYARPDILNQGDQNGNPLIPMAMASETGVRDRFIGGMTVRYNPFSWMDLEGNFSYDYGGYVDRYFQDKGYRTTTQARSAGGSVGQISDTRSLSTSLNTSVNATIRKNFGSDLQTTWNLRYLYNQQDNNNNYGYGNTLAAVGVPILSNATAGFSISSYSTSVREIGYSAGLSVDYKQRYIAEGLVRRDGSSLFGSAQRWATFGRGSLAWRMSQESWWPFRDVLNEFKIRGSRGSAGGRPNFYAQYETFSVSAGGVSLGTLGNKNLKPEVTTETELGADIEILRRFGLTITHAQSTTVNQILQVPVAAEFGFGTQWQNAGTLDNKTWELSLNVPILQKRDLSWSWRFSYDQTRTVITALNVPPFSYGVGWQQGATTIFRANAGEAYGTFYGIKLAMKCSDLPAPWSADCGGPGKDYQINDQGFVTWTGGLSPSQGITNNAYTAQLPGGTNAAMAPFATTPDSIAHKFGPWGVAVNWGMLIPVRDTACGLLLTKADSTAHPTWSGPRTDCPDLQQALGNALPKFNFSITQNFQWKRLSIYALLQASIGRKVWNEGRHWSYLDFVSGDLDQTGRSVQEAKPIGYYYRAAPPENGSGIGGFYQLLGPTSFFVEDASYGKLRELSVAYNVGPIAGWGNWTVSLVGRNLFTITGYHGFDPETGLAGSSTGSAAINAVDAFAFPNTRSLTFSLATSF